MAADALAAFETATALSGRVARHDQALGAKRVSPPAVDVAIVNWNTAEAALHAADSFLASRGVSARVSIVDNHSRGEQRDLLRDGRGDSTQLHLADRNLGYGAAANLVLRDGTSELVCVSNADLVLHPDALAQLAAVALGDPAAGMVGPVFEGGTDHYHSHLPGPIALLARPMVGSAGRRRSKTPQPGETARIGQVSGACFVIRRELWSELGGFDEGYFLWYDDVDLAKRLEDRGHRNLVVGSARVQHRGAGSFSQIDRRTAQAIRLSSLERYIGKHHARLLPVARPLLAVSRSIRARGTGNATR